jgi:TolB protein
VRSRIVILVCFLPLIGLVGGCSYFFGGGLEYTHWEPALSPDGRLLAYESVIDENVELFLRDLGTDTLRRLTENEYPDWSPTWSPTGDRIAFVSSRDDNYDIYVLTISDLSVERLTTDAGDDINPDWGVDGLIYFNSNRSGAWEIYTIDPIGRSLVKLTQVAGPSD